MIWHYEILFQRRFKVQENICESSRVYPKYYHMETHANFHVPSITGMYQNPKQICLIASWGITAYCYVLTLKHLSSLTFKEIFVSLVHIMMISRIINRKTKSSINFWPPELCKILISLSWFYLVIFPLSFKKKKKKNIQQERMIYETRWYNVL